jgi:hypothetical protein
MTDYIGTPVHYCKEHDERYYYHCRACFNPHQERPVHLRVNASVPSRKKGRRK